MGISMQNLRPAAALTVLVIQQVYIEESLR